VSTELNISIISFVVSAILIKYMSLNKLSINVSLFKKVIAGIFSLVFFISSAAWMVLFGDSLAVWVTSPEDGQFFSLLLSAIVFLSLYIISFRTGAPYPATEFLVFALASISLQSETSISTNKLIKFLRKRAFDQFLKEVQPDSQGHVMQQRLNLIDHLHQQQTTTEGLKQLENGNIADIIDANKPFPIMISRHPFFKYLKRLTINPQERKAYLQLVNLQIQEIAQYDTVARSSFLRQVYDFVQAIAHEPFLKQYTQFFNTLSLSMDKFLSTEEKGNASESIFLFEISAAVLQRIESTYINPSKLNTIATLRFRSDPVAALN
jgi:hypothetical protein